MTVINKSSAALEPGVDLPAHGVDVIVTELVDSGLLGEHIIPVLADARARGLLAEGGRVVPEVGRMGTRALRSGFLRGKCTGGRTPLCKVCTRVLWHYSVSVVTP